MAKSDALDWKDLRVGDESRGFAHNDPDKKLQVAQDLSSRLKACDPEAEKRGEGEEGGEGAEGGGAEAGEGAVWERCADGDEPVWERGVYVLLRHERDAAGYSEGCLPAGAGGGGDVLHQLQ